MYANCILHLVALFQILLMDNSQAVCCFAIFDCNMIAFVLRNNHLLSYKLFLFKSKLWTMTITNFIFSANATALLRVSMIVKGYLMVFDNWNMDVRNPAVRWRNIATYTSFIRCDRYQCIQLTSLDILLSSSSRHILGNVSRHLR